MLPLPDNVRILDLATNKDIDARIIELTASVVHMGIDKRWWTVPGVAKELLDAQPDATWQDWAAIAAQAQDSADYVCAGCITLTDKQVQGAILYWTGGHSLFDPALGAVEVMLLATAPGNRAFPDVIPKFRGAGSSLLLRAVAHSYLLGLKGRTILAAKPNPGTVDFYTNKGFRSHSAAADGKINMELQEEAALAWLRAKGLIS